MLGWMLGWGGHWVPPRQLWHFRAWEICPAAPRAPLAAPAEPAQGRRPHPPEDLQIAGSTGSLALDKPKAAVTWFPVARGSRWHSLSLMRLGNDSSSTRIIGRIIFFSSLTFIPDLLFLELISLLLSKPLEQPLSFLTSCHQMFFSNQNHHSPGQETSRQRHLPVAQHSRWLST